MIKKLKNSLSFRYQHWLKQQKIKQVDRAVKLHEEKMTAISAKDFSIIASNCWGGAVYEDLDLPYQSPTIGLYFFAPCFLELLSNLEQNINLPLSFKKASKYEEANHYRREKEKYPVGQLGEEIEIQFLHYKTEQEACEKWERRKQRINWDRLFVACTDRDLMTPDLMRKFDALSYDKKVLFTGRPNKRLKSVVHLKAFKKEGIVGDLYNQRYLVTPDFDLKNWLE